MSSFPLNSQAECTKIQRGRGIISPDSKLECLEAITWRANSADLMEAVCACLNRRLDLKEEKEEKEGIQIFSLKMHKDYFY